MDWHPCFHLPKQPQASGWQALYYFFWKIDSSHFLFFTHRWPWFMGSGGVDSKAHSVFPENQSSHWRHKALWAIAEYLPFRSRPSKSCGLSAFSPFPTLLLLSLLTFTSDILFFLSSCELEIILLKRHKPMDPLLVFVWACMCGKWADVVKGEAAERTAALTRWQMKIKRLLLKVGGVCVFSDGPLRARARPSARNGERWCKDQRAPGGAAAHGKPVKPDGGFLSPAATARLQRFFRVQ